jgi:hypothetical protein
VRVASQLATLRWYHPCQFLPEVECSVTKSPWSAPCPQFRVSPARWLAGAWLACALPSLALALEEELVLVADLDNTLYETDMDTEEQQNEMSNGAGSFLFAGRTKQDAGFRLRRGLLRFDLSALPEGARIVSAELTLHQSNIAPGAFPVEISLHRALEQWGEGASDGIGPEGQGAPAQAGDATWFHRLYDTAEWTTGGGTFTATASATTTFGLDIADYTFACTPGLMEDINSWLSSSASNFGWVIVGNEDGGGTARRFNSRSHGDEETRPRLKVVYQPAELVHSDGFETLDSCGEPGQFSGQP